MSSRHDPYPMMSKEAKALEGTVEGGGVDEPADWSLMNAWSSMETTSNNPGPSTMTSYDDAANSLMRRNKSGEAEDDAVYPYGDAQSRLEEEGDDDDDKDDNFFDVPLQELHGTTWDRLVGSTKRNFHKLCKRLYGDDLPPREMLRILCLGSTLFFMIGSYWLLRSLKDSILGALCGYEAIPKAKMLSVVVVLGVVSVYNYLLDSDIPKHRLFYIFGTFYFGIFSAISFCLMDEKIGLANEHADPGRLLGWISYCSIESFGSVMVSLFWSFTNSNISVEKAKAGFGLMVAIAQVGSIIGPAFVHAYSETIGPAKCYMLGAFGMLLLQGTMVLYIRIYGTAETKQQKDVSTNTNTSTSAAPPKKKERAGILEGLKLFWKYNYVKGIFAISCLFMVEVTIVDFTLKLLARDFFASKYPCDISDTCYDAERDVYNLTTEATNAVASFLGLFGVATNTLSFFFSLLGTSAVIRYLGLRSTLLLFPSLCLAVIIMVRLYPTLNIVFFAMIMLKACSYALNNPTKEILYQPTSTAIRYKSKSWIDIFGARGSKAVGSIVTNAFSDSSDMLVANGSLVGMAVASFLIWNARFMGKLFDEYSESGYIVGEEDNPESKNIEMAIGQNEVANTSCAILDGDEDDDDDDDDGDDEVVFEKESSQAEDDDDDDDENDSSRGPIVATV